VACPGGHQSVAPVRSKAGEEGAFEEGEVKKLFILFLLLIDILFEQGPTTTTTTTRTSEPMTSSSNNGDWAWLDRANADDATTTSGQNNGGGSSFLNNHNNGLLAGGMDDSHWLSGNDARLELKTDELFGGGVSPARKSFAQEEEDLPGFLPDGLSPGTYFGRKSAASADVLFNSSNGGRGPSSDTASSRKKQDVYTTDMDKNHHRAAELSVHADRNMSRETQMMAEDRRVPVKSMSRNKAVEGLRVETSRFINNSSASNGSHREAKSSRGSNGTATQVSDRQATSMPSSSISSQNGLRIECLPGKRRVVQVDFYNARDFSSSLSLRWSPPVEGFSARLLTTRVRPRESSKIEVVYHPVQESMAECLLCISDDAGMSAHVPIQLVSEKPSASFSQNWILASKRSLDFGQVDVNLGGSVELFLKNSSPWSARLALKIDRENPMACFSVDFPEHDSQIDPGAVVPVLVDLLPDTHYANDTRYSCVLVRDLLFQPS